VFSGFGIGVKVGGGSVKINGSGIGLVLGRIGAGADGIGAGIAGALHPIKTRANPTPIIFCSSSIWFMCISFRAKAPLYLIKLAKGLHWPAFGYRKLS